MKKKTGFIDPGEDCDNGEATTCCPVHTRTNIHAHTHTLPLLRDFINFLYTHVIITGPQLSCDVWPDLHRYFRNCHRTAISLPHVTCGRKRRIPAAVRTASRYVTRGCCVIFRRPIEEEQANCVCDTTPPSSTHAWLYALYMAITRTAFLVPKPNHRYF